MFKIPSIQGRPIMGVEDEDQITNISEENYWGQSNEDNKDFK